MSFEDLLKPRPAPCKTCAFIETIEPKPLRQEVDAAMAKPKFTDVSLARALAALGGTAPGPGAIANHRQRDHRKT